MFCNGRVRVTTKVRSMLLLQPVNVNLLRKWLGTIPYFNIIKATVSISKNKYLMEYDKLLTIGNQTKPKLNPVPVNEHHERCEWMKFGPVTSAKTSYCKCCEWNNSKANPVPATKSKYCEWHE